MGAQTRAQLKSWFETGDVPTEAQYTDLIDSSPNIADDMVGRPANLIFKKITIPSALVLTLNTAPIALISAPGAGKFIEIMNPALAKMVFNSVIYDTNTDLTIYGNVATLAPIGLNTFILASNGNVFEMFDLGAASGSIYYAENQAIFLTVDNGNPLNGDSDLIIYITYSITTI